MPKIEITDEMIRVFGEAWDQANTHDGAYEPGDRRRAGLAAVLPLIEAQIDAVPGLRPEDYRYRALQLAVEYGKHDPEYSEAEALSVAETFREYLETGATDAD